MEFLIKDAKNYLNQEVTLRGWVFNKRSSGAIVFLQIRDGSGFVQGVVAKNEVAPAIFKAAETISDESSVRVSGQLREELRSPFGLEMQVKELEIISLAESPFPIAPKEHGIDFLLAQRHLWLRSQRQWAILRLRHQVMASVSNFLQSRGYTRLDSPILTPSACEGTTTLFPVPYLPAWPASAEATAGEPEGVPSWINSPEDKPYVFLSQSGQLYLEAAIASLGKVYDFGPTFRAEKSKTKRHLTEFWMMDAEEAFLEYEGLLDFEERLVCAVVRDVLQQSGAELRILDRPTEALRQIQSPFPRLTYQETIEKLHQLGSDIKDGEDLGNDDETLLMTHFKQPLFVLKFPPSLKAFYFKRAPEDETLTLSADLLAPEGYGEILGGGQREDNYQTLRRRVKENNWDEKDYAWYLDLRKYGSVPHSGFGLGLERLVAWLGGLEHIREAIPFPRTIYRFSP